MRRAHLLLALFAVTACTQAVDPSTTTVLEASGPGRLAIVDGDGDIVVIDPDGSDAQKIAADDDGVLLGQPIWSPDGSAVSWARADPEGFSYVVSHLDSGSEVTVALDNYPFYAYWSPDSESIGVLRNGDQTVVFELIDVEAGTVERVSEDAPFYFSWSPSGGEVAAHAGAARLLLVGPEAPLADPRPTDPGYLAPQWTGSGVVHVVESRLVVERVDGTRSAIADVEGLTTFVVDPTGRRVALQSIAPGSGISVAVGASEVVANRVMVIDLESGEETTVSETPAAGFFWSRDGERLLTLIPDAGLLAASVWSEDGAGEYATFLPSAVQVRDLLPFFPQYAQSLSFWSADATAFAVVGEIDGTAGVWVQDIDEDEARFISEGTWAAWSS